MANRNNGLFEDIDNMTIEQVIENIRKVTFLADTVDIKQDYREYLEEVKETAIDNELRDLILEYWNCKASKFKFLYQLTLLTQRHRELDAQASIYKLNKEEKIEILHVIKHRKRQVKQLERVLIRIVERPHAKDEVNEVFETFTSTLDKLGRLYGDLSILDDLLEIN